MKKIMISLFLATYALVVDATIQVELDPSPARVNETVQLTLTQNGASSGGVPNLRGLQKNFLILGTARQVSYALVNGRSTTLSQWVISLKPLKTGVLSIPAIKIGSEQTDPMTINVEAASGATSSSSPDEASLDDSTETRGQDARSLILKTSMNQEKPYVNQEIIYTVKLFNSTNLLDAEYQAPKAEDALIIPLGDARRYQQVLGSTHYVVEEQRYAVFPQKSGRLTISSPTFTALIYDFNPHRVTVQDKETEVSVQAIPKQYQNEWLPAKAVTLTEHYENKSQSIAQGSTLVRTIILEGTGIPAQLLPALSFKGTNELNVYPEKSTERNQVRQGELVGSTEYKITYLFNKPGTIKIPELIVPWFNTHTGKAEAAVLPEQSIQVTPVLTPLSDTLKGAREQPDQGNTSSLKPLSTQTVTTQSTEYFGSWLVAGFFAVAWFLTLCLWARQKGTRGTKGSYNTVLGQLKKACANAQPKEARDALLKWSALQWPDARILNLHDLVELVNQVELKKQIQILSHALYKQDAASLWRGEALFDAVKAMKKGTHAPRKKQKIDLPPINPN